VARWQAVRKKGRAGAEWVALQLGTLGG